MLTDIEDTSRIILQNGTTLDALKKALYDAAQEKGIYIDVEENQITSGGMIRKKVYPCLVISHPEHKSDYYQYCIMLTTDSTRTYIELFRKGVSRLESKIQYGGKLSRFLHGNQYEIEYKAESAFYNTLKKIWESFHD